MKIMVETNATDFDLKDGNVLTITQVVGVKNLGNPTKVCGGCGKPLKPAMICSECYDDDISLESDGADLFLL